MIKVLYGTMITVNVLYDFCFLIVSAVLITCSALQIMNQRRDKRMLIVLTLFLLDYIVYAGIVDTYTLARMAMDKPGERVLWLEWIN